MKVRVTQIRVIDGKRFAILAPAELAASEQVDVGTILDVAPAMAVTSRPPDEPVAVTATKPQPTNTAVNRISEQITRSAKDVDVLG